MFMLPLYACESSYTFKQLYLITDTKTDAFSLCTQRSHSTQQDFYPLKNGRTNAIWHFGLDYSIIRILTSYSPKGKLTYSWNMQHPKEIFVPKS